MPPQSIRRSVGNLGILFCMALLAIESTVALLIATTNTVRVLSLCRRHACGLAMADRRGSQRANPFFSGETKSSGRPCESGTVGSRSTDHQKQNEKDANGWHRTSDLRTMQR